MTMVAADVTGHPPVHERTERRVGGWWHHEVEMMGHQTDAEHVDRMFRLGHRKQVEEGGVILILVKDERAAVAAIEHMVGMASELSTGNARHGASRY